MADQNNNRVSQLEGDMMEYQETLAKSRAAVAHAREVIAEGERLQRILKITSHQARTKMIEMGFRKAPNNNSPMKRSKRRMAI